MSIDTYHNTKVTPVITIDANKAAGMTSGSIIDTAGMRSTLFVVRTGAQGAGVTQVLPHIVRSNASTGGFTSALAAELLGTAAAVNTKLAGATGATKAAKIGYVGTHRFAKFRLTIGGTTTGRYRVDCYQQHAMKGPQAVP
jgi:hypothetical protein